jgi:uncharacterized membrane protein
MEPLPQLTKQQAQKRADRIGAFRAELQELEQSGALTLSEDQRKSVLSHHEAILQNFAELYDIDASEDQKQLSIGMRIASLLGAIALCVAVYLFFYNYWGAISTPLQVALLGGAPVVALIGVDFAARKDRSLYFATIAAAIAFACFMLDLGALGHIFNMVPTSMALLAWALLGALLAYAYGLRLPLIAAAACIVFFIAGSLATLGGAPFDVFMDRPETLIPGGAALLAVAIFVPHGRRAGFPPVLRVCGMIALFCALIVMSIWGEGSYLSWNADAVEAGYQILGFMLSALAIWLGIRRGWLDLTYLASAAFAILLFIKCFHWLWGWMPKYLFFLILGLVAVGLLLILKRLRSASP